MRTRMTGIFALTAAAAFIAAIAAPAMAANTAATWTTRTIDPSPDPKNPIALTIDNTGKNPQYSANGLQIKWDSFDKGPRDADTFSFAFDTSSFTIVEDKTFEAANNGSAAEDLQSKVDAFDVANDILHPNLKVLTIDISYKDTAVPQDYKDFLKGKSWAGYAAITYDPAADQNGVSNIITAIYIDIGNADPPGAPEPASLLLLAPALAALSIRRPRPHLRIN